MIRITRILLSLTIPTLLGIVLYSCFSGMYQESLFWLGIIFTIPNLFLLMLLPLSIYTGIMEFLGKKLIQKSNQTFLHSLIFLVVGSGIGICYSFISDDCSMEWYVMIFITGLTVSSLKLWLHFKER